MATREELAAVAYAHAQAEADGDMAATLATLEDDPLYEFQPAGVVLRGKEAAERYYDWFFHHVEMQIEGFEVRNEWITDAGLGQEYILRVKLPDGTRRRFDLTSILTFGDTKLSGERIYASDELFRHMVGPAYADAVPLEG
jgi:SnoaL-like domain